MTTSFDVRSLTTTKRLNVARSIQQLTDIKMPKLKYWNYDLCRVHRNGWEENFTDPQTGEQKTQIVTHRPPRWCRKCGIRFYKHQRVSILWLYYKKHALLADTMGSGKTTSAGGLIAMLLETGELPQNGRVIIVPRATATHQWRAELMRMIPTLRIAMGEGSKKKRTQAYLSDWDVLLLGPETFRNDYEMLSKIPLAALITDDIDFLRNPDTQASLVLDEVGRKADRYVIMTGTPLQKRLPELYSVLDAIGGEYEFGSMKNFLRRYVRYATRETLDARTGGVSMTAQIVGYQNLAEMKERIAPMVLRRTSFDDVAFPVINPVDEYIDLYPSQRAKYQELQRGVLTILDEAGDEKVKHTTALSKIHYGAAICAGMFAVGEDDGEGRSAKLDWIMEALSESGVTNGEKVVIYARLKVTIRALQKRLSDAGIGYVTVWGEDKKQERFASQETFWNDPNCRVLLGTGAIEQSLNLQVSRYLINVDLILNPARMGQLAGRIRRAGSKYSSVNVINLISYNTQEERYLAVLERESALADYVWDETSELFQALSARELMMLISG